MKTVTIRANITARDIRFGHRGNCERCPAARAFRRTISRHPEYGVSGLAVSNDMLEVYYTVETEKGTRTLRYGMPTVLVDFIGRFDGGRTVTPFRTEMKIKVADNGD